MKNLVDYSEKLIRIKRVSRLVILATALLAAVIIFITIYATQVGNFVIKSANRDLMLLLSETRDFATSYNSLNAKGVSDLNNTTLSRIDIERIKSVDGSYNSKLHFGYSFYLQNQSNLMINYEMTMTVNEVNNNVDEALWILVIEERNDVENITVYAKESKNGGYENCLDTLLESRDYSFEQFASNLTIFTNVVENMRKDEIIKYTFIMWLEGEDPDCINDILGGSIRMELNFSAYR